MDGTHSSYGSNNISNCSFPIVLYKGPGIDDSCFVAMKKKVEQIVDERFHQIQIINTSDDLLQRLYWYSGDVIPTTFIPGGFTPSILQGQEFTNTDEDLGLGVPFRKIHFQELNRSGSQFFGTCAGGISTTSSLIERLSSTLLDGDKGGLIGEKVVVADKNNLDALKLIPVNSYAPVIVARKGFAFPLTTDHVQLVEVNVDLPTPNTLKVMNILGPAYQPLDQRVEVISRFRFLRDIHVGSLTPYPPRNVIFHSKKTIQGNQLAETVSWKDNEKSGRVTCTSCHYEMDSAFVRSDSFKYTFDGITPDETENLAQQLEPFDKLRDNVLKSMWTPFNIHVKPQ